MTLNSKIQLITETNIKYAEDITYIIKMFRQYAREASLSAKQITRFATALTEITRNALQYAGGANIALSIYEKNNEYYFSAHIKDNGNGIEDIEDILAENHEGSGVGIIVSRKLLNIFEIETSEKGTKVFLAERLHHSKSIDSEDIKSWKSKVKNEKKEDNSLRELLEAYETIREKENQLEITNRKLKKFVTQLKSKNSELKNFAKVVSHDLKSPLNVVFMASEMLASFYKDEMGEESEEMLDMIVSSCNNMKQLINDYLNYASSAAQNDQREPIELNEVVTEIFEMISEPKQKNIKIEKGTLHQIFYDKVAIKQVIQNLLTNAIKYSDKQVIKIKVSSIKNNTHTILKVEDNGPGIPESHFKDIFELYRTVGVNGIAKKGTGVGLPLIKRIAERNNGKVWIESKLNEGAIFYFSIPNNLEPVFEDV